MVSFNRQKLPSNTLTKYSRQALFFTIKADSILSSQAHTLLSSQPPPHSPPPRSIAQKGGDIDQTFKCSVKEDISAQNLGKAECSNCKFLAEKVKTLEENIKILEGALEMERHPEKHTLESAAILHELYNDMGKLGLE
ncbi:hypothetical protein Tco_0145995 [Tanacetum coccineum]